MDDHARCVQDAPQPWRARGGQLVAQPCREVAGLGARTDLLARTVEQRPCCVDGERVVDTARQLVHGREIAQLHVQKAIRA